MTDSEPLRHSHYPLSLLRDLAVPATRDRILEGAAKELRQGKGDVISVFSQGLRNSIPGFRDPLKAPLPRFARELNRFLFRQSVWTRDLLGLWMESVDGLAERIEAFLDMAPQEEKLAQLLATPADEWTAVALLGLAGVYAERFPGLDRTEVAIVIGDRLWALADSSEEDESDHDEGSDEEEHERDARAEDGVAASEHYAGEERSDEPLMRALEDLLDPLPPPVDASRFTRLIAELDDLPWGAAEWEELPRFLAALVRARGRAARRGEVLHSALIQRLRGLFEQHAGALRFVEYRGVSRVEDVRIESRNLVALQSLCDTLEERLHALSAALGSLPTSSGLREWSTLTDHLAEQIRPLLAKLEALVRAAEPSNEAMMAEPIASPVAALVRGESEVVEVEASGVTTSPPDEAPLSFPSPVPTAAPDRLLPPAVEFPRDVPAPVPVMSVQPSDEHIVEPAAPPLVVDAGPDTARPDHRGAHLLAAVAQGDLAAAYWIARSFATGDVPSPFPDWLLAAAQAAPWLSHGSGAFVEELLDTATARQPTGLAEHLLGLSVALKGALLAPGSGLAAWLKPQDLPRGAVRDLSEAVAEFAAYNTALHPDDLPGLSGDAQLNAAARAASVDARQNLETAEALRWKMRRAHQVWVHFCRRELPGLLAPVASDQRGRVAEVRGALERWRRSKDVLVWIEEVDARFSYGPQKPIVGDPRDQILRRVQDSCEVARRWCDLVERAAITQTRGNWLVERIRALQGALAAALPRADRELVALNNPSEPPVIAVAARTLRCALSDLAKVLQLPVSLQIERGAYDGALLRAIEDAPELGRVLAARLLWLPELELESDGQPRADSETAIVEMLEVAARESRPLLDSYRGWVSRQDFRFVDRIGRALMDAPEFAAAQDEMNRAKEVARASLRAEVGRTQEAIEQAMVDSLLSDGQRAEYAALTEIEVQDVLEFRPRVAALAGIRRELDAVRLLRLSHAKKRWQALESELAPRFAGPRWDGVRGFVEALMARNEPAFLECLERLEEEVRGHQRLPDDWGIAPVDRDTFAEFLESLPQLEEIAQGGLGSLVRTIRDRGASFRDFSDFPKSRLEEAQRAIEDWIALKTGSWSTTAIVSRLRGLLGFVGFTLPADVNRLAVASEGPDWAHVRAKMSANDLSPVPQFGSQSRGIYDILCVRERPGVDLLAARLRDAQLEGHPVIVVYLARLPLNRRRELNRLTRRGDLPIVALDESLLLFLLGEWDARLPVFFRCTLPFSSVNPFTPAQAGDVPPEMFYGRREMVRELERPEGGCVVYGGRQLGKSVLLRRVERDLHVRDRSSYARVIDIKLVGDPHSDVPVDEVWRRVRDAFKEFELLPGRVSTDQPKEIIRQVRDVLKGREIQQIALLFDEADAFLDADSRQGFRVVTELRDLMNETGRRFKVVFAGLQNVQRFQGIPNQPLAHFGQPIRVGPLEPEAAERLVREPLQALGYRFAESSVLLRVLSYTNYHPGLIQLFCQQLLRAHRAASGMASPPYVIRAEDVERVYRQPMVRDSIRDRFDWTLALDPRYQCTAWAMIVDQVSEQDGYAHTYSPREALALVRSYWSDGFKDVNLDRYRAVLDEMEGLGVLRRTPEGQYRLRSPNLIRLMGREADIGERLMDLSERPAILVSDADSYRAALDNETRPRRYSPLTYGDGRRVVASQSGVSLVFGSPALGIDLVQESLDRALFGVGSGREPKILTDLAACGTDRERLRGRIQKFMRANQRYDRLVALEIVEGDDPSVAGRMEASLEIIREQSERRGSTVFRLVFVFPPVAALRWLAAGKMPVELESRVDATVSLSPWNIAGLRRRLEQQDKIASETHCQRLLEVTGGWPALVDEVFSRSVRAGDVLGAADEIQAEMSNGGPLGRALVERLGLDAAPAARALLAFVAELGSVGPEDLLPDLIDQTLSERDCRTLGEWSARMGLLIARDGRWSVDPVIGRVLFGA